DSVTHSHTRDIYIYRDHMGAGRSKQNKEDWVWIHITNQRASWFPPLSRTKPRDKPLLLLLLPPPHPLGWISSSDHIQAAQAREETRSTVGNQTRQRAAMTFDKVEELRPGTYGHNLQLRVLSAKPVVLHRPQGGRAGGNMRIAECIVGDDTGVVVFTARNEQVDIMKPGAVVEARKARVDMYKGSMRLAVDKWGTLKAAESPADFKVKEDNNVSLVEFELITVMQ
uniref:Single-stranded DNA binding protein Ssb-like OB fold domain-containing protein n=5 Tax=Triticinae TaxID=1648030 RepID=A0A452XHK7_AEGTS